MFVRILEAQEILPALHLVWDVFAADVAPYYEPAGVAEFQKFIKYENVMPGVQKGETVFFGAWEGQELCGVSALNLRQGGHIALLFVRKEWQLRGVGRTLYQEMCRFCVQRLRINRITVNAAPGSGRKLPPLWDARNRARAEGERNAFCSHGSCSLRQYVRG